MGSSALGCTTGKKFDGSVESSESEPNSKSVGQKTKTMLKRSIELRGTAQ